MSRTIVTGSAGFLGSNLIRFLLFNNKNSSVFGIDKLKNVSYIHNVYINKSSEFYLADVCDKDTMHKIFEICKPDCVIHMSSIKNDNINNANELEMISNNINGLAIMANLCVEFNSKLIYVSTTDVYDYNNDIKKDEQSPTFCSNKYIASKLCCENLLTSFGIENNLNYTIIRATEIFGPRQHCGIIVDMFLDIKGNNKILLNNKGNIIRDLLHVEDFSNAVYLIMEKGKDKEIYNLSANIDFTDLEIASMIIESLNEGKIEFTQNDVENKYIEINCDKIKQLGWKPIKKFKNRIKDSILWYNNNQWFFK